MLPKIEMLSRMKNSKISEWSITRDNYKVNYWNLVLTLADSYLSTDSLLGTLFSLKNMKNQGFCLRKSFLQEILNNRNCIIIICMKRTSQLPFLLKESYKKQSPKWVISKFMLKNILYDKWTYALWVSIFLL